MDKAIKISRWLIFIGFTFPVIWCLAFEYYLLPESYNADFDAGMAIAFLYGVRGIFEIMAFFELVGSSILSWKLIKNVEYRTRGNAIVLSIGLLGSIIAILIRVYF